MKPLPDTTLVARATKIARDALPDVLLAHARRTFLLARAVAENRQIAFDEEGLLVASLLHDVGLSDRERNPRAPFPSVGAARLRELLDDAGADARRRDTLADAIELHMRWFPRWSRGAEVGLLHAGAWMDVTGRGSYQVTTTARATIHARHPREGLSATYRRQLWKALGSWAACTVLVLP